MNLEKLVPPVDLCKLIPAGEFEDAAHAWHLTDMVGFVCRTSGCEQVSGKQWQLTRSNASRIIRARKRGELIFPAPMLEEIMVKLPRTVKTDFIGEQFHICNDVKNGYGVSNVSPSTAALKLWLKQKGIEDGK